MSGPYLHGHHASVLRSHSWRTVENSCPHLLPYLKNPTLKILDVGCGPGTISVDLASRIPQGFVYAIDPSADVIAKARQHAEEKGVSNVRFEVGDIFKWADLDGVEEASFDVVHAHQVLQHLQDPLGAMKQMVRLVKPGGVLAVRDCDYSAMSWYPEHPGMDKWKELYINVANGLKAYPNMGKSLHAVAMQAGIPRSDIEASIGAWVFSTPEERAWVLTTVDVLSGCRCTNSAHSGAASGPIGRRKAITGNAPSITASQQTLTSKRLPKRSAKWKRKTTAGSQSSTGKSSATSSSRRNPNLETFPALSLPLPSPSLLSPASPPTHSSSPHTLPESFSHAHLTAPPITRALTPPSSDRARLSLLTTKYQPHLAPPKPPRPSATHLCTSSQPTNHHQTHNHTYRQNAVLHHPRRKRPLHLPQVRLLHRRLDQVVRLLRKREFACLLT
jgi:ubiquinone/menaquinone biosynthesis C-methylase UbiE